jgi:hypothetical protein
VIHTDLKDGPAQMERRTLGQRPNGSLPDQDLLSVLVTSLSHIRSQLLHHNESSNDVDLSGSTPKAFAWLKKNMFMVLMCFPTNKEFCRKICS